MIVIDWQIAMLLILAGGLATYIRLKDTPAVILFKDDKIIIAGVVVAVETFVVATVAAMLTAWVLAEQSGVYITEVGGFAAICGAALGGMATVRAALNLSIAKA
jgi:hypothetical protein